MYTSLYFWNSVHVFTYSQLCLLKWNSHKWNVSSNCFLYCFWPHVSQIFCKLKLHVFFSPNGFDLGQSGLCMYFNYRLVFIHPSWFDCIFAFKNFSGRLFFEKAIYWPQICIFHVNTLLFKISIFLANENCYYRRGVSLENTFYHSVIVTLNTCM